MPDANLTRSVMYLFDCFFDDFRDEKYMATLSDLDVRAQVEVRLKLYLEKEEIYRNYQMGFFLIANASRLTFHVLRCKR